MLVIARALSAMGSSLTVFSIDIWLFQQNGSYSVFALLAVASSLPALMFSPFAGVLVDRFSRKLLLLWCEALSALAVLLLLWASAAGALTPVLVGVVAVALGLLNAVSWPAAMASVTDLASEAQRPRVNGIAETLNGVVVIVCPLLGAALTSTIGLSGLIAIDIFSYVVCLVLLALIRFPASPEPGPARGGAMDGQAAAVTRELLFGVRWIGRRKNLLLLLLFFTIVNIGSSIVAIAFAPYVLAVTSPLGLGICMAVAGGGITVGGLLFAYTGGMKRHESGVLLGGLISGLCMLGFGLFRTPWAIYLCLLVEGLTIPLMNASSQTIWQSAVPGEIQGRVFAVRRMIAWGLNPLAILLSIPMVTSLFLPLLALGGGTWTLGQAWGSGQSGALGLMISTFGALTFCFAALIWLGDGLGVRSRAGTRADPDGA